MATMNSIITPVSGRIVLLILLPNAPGLEYQFGMTELRIGPMDLSLRIGTRPQDNVYFSATYLDAAAHIAHLEDLREALPRNN